MSLALVMQYADIIKTSIHLRHGFTLQLVKKMRPPLWFYMLQTLLHNFSSLPLKPCIGMAVFVKLGQFHSVPAALGVCALSHARLSLDAIMRIHIMTCAGAHSYTSKHCGSTNGLLDYIKSPHGPQR